MSKFESMATKTMSKKRKHCCQDEENDETPFEIEFPQEEARFRQENIKWLKQEVKEQGPLYADLVDLAIFQSQAHPHPWAGEPKHVLLILIRNQLARWIKHGFRQKTRDWHDWIYRLSYHRRFIKSFDQIQQHNNELITWMKNVFLSTPLSSPWTTSMRAPMPFVDVCFPPVHPQDFQDDFDNFFLNVNWDTRTSHSERHISWRLPLCVRGCNSSGLAVQIALPSILVGGQQSWIFDCSVLMVPWTPQEEGTSYQSQKKKFDVECRLYFLDEHLFYSRARVDVECAIDPWLKVMHRLRHLYPLLFERFPETFSLVWQYLTVIEF
jgi:hypothetical protein